MANCKKLFFLLLSFVLLCCAVPAFAVDEYTFEVNFFETCDTDTKVCENPIAYNGTETFFAYVEIEDKTDLTKIYWSYAVLASSNDGKTWSAALKNFWPITKEDEQKGINPTSVIYNSDTHQLRTSEGNGYRSRLFIEKPTYYAIHTEGVAKPNDTIPGYQFIDNDTTDLAKSSVKIKKLEHEPLFIARLDFEPKLSTAISTADLYYLLVEVTHENTGKTYALIPLETNGTDPCYEVPHVKEMEQFYRFTSLKKS